MLILKQNSANSVPTPPAGKGTIFLDDSDTLSVKTSDGNVETFPTVAAANTQVVFIDGTALSGNANFVYNKNTDTLTLTGSLAAGNVKTDNLQYANGAPWDLSDPGGSNTQVQFNDDESFGGSAAFTFNKTTNAVSMGGSLTVTGNASAGNLSTGGALSATGNANVGNLGTGGLIVATGNITGGNLVTAGTANVGELTASGNAVITGNLTVNGNVTYVNVDTLQVEDPVISLGGGPNGAPLTSNDGKDRGTLLNYYTTSAIDAFMGWDNSNGEFAFGSNVSIVNDVVTFNTLGNVRVGNIIGNGQALTGLTGANVTGQVGNALVAGTVYTNAQPNITSVGTLTSLGVSGTLTAANITANTGVFTGNAAGLTNIPGGNIVGNISGNISNANFAAYAANVTNAAQPNITSVGTLTSLLAGTTSLAADFPNSTSIFSHDNTGVLGSDNFGLVGEATGDSANASTTGVGVFGIGKANGGTRGTGVQGFATVTNSADTGAAVGVRGYATSTHSGGYNIGVLGNAAGSGFGNYAFYVQAGNIASIETDTAWDLNDNSANALAFNSSGKANILRISTVDGSEGVAMSGTLDVTGNATVGGIKTNNYYYANGTPVDFQQAGGTNTQVQFNDADGFGGSAAFTFDKVSNVVTMSGNLSVANVQATGALVGATVTSNGTANVGNLSTAGTVTATGNVSGGNLTTAGVVAATGNVSGGNITTAGVVTATGNVSGGNLTTAGALSVTGNANVGNLGTGGLIVATGNISGGNINTAGKVVASTFESNVATGTAPMVVASTTKVANLNADLLDGYSTDTAATANTIVVRDADGSFSANIVTATLSGAATTAGTVTTAAQPNITSVGTLTSLAVTGNATAGNVYANSGTIGASLLTGTLTTAAQPNITSVGTLSSLAVTGNVAAGNLTTAGVLTVSGTGVSSIAGNLDMTSNTIINLANPTNDQDAATKAYVDQIAQGLHVHAPCAAATPDTLANVTSGTITYNNGTAGVGANLVTTGSFDLIDGVNVQTSGTRILVKNEANAAHNGIYTWANSTTIVRATDFDTPTEMAGGDFTFVSAGTIYNDTGWVMTDPVTTVGTTPVTFVQFSGAGTYTAGTGLTLTGTVFSVNASQSQITSVGTLSFLGVDGNLTAANVFANTGAFYGNGSGLTNLAGGNVTGQVANALVAGTVYTAAQPNITSVGTLTSLDVSGTITASNVTANTGIFTGNGSGITALNASNISSGTLAQARLANASLTVNGTSISLGGSGTITANTTQTLTLGSFLTGTSFNGGTAVTANVDATSANTASKVVARDASGNFSAGTITATLSGAATTAGTVTTAAQPNITSVGTLTSLTTSGDIVCGGYFDASVNAAVSAAGTAQGNATVIASQVNVVSTVASGAGVALPTAVAGYRITLINTAANACLVYPATGGQINALGTNASYSLPAGGRLDFQAVSTTQWYTLNATYG